MPCWVIHSGPIGFCNSVRSGYKSEVVLGNEWLWMQSEMATKDEKDSSGPNLNGKIKPLLLGLWAGEVDPLVFATVSGQATKNEKDSSGPNLNGKIQALVVRLVAEEDSPCKSKNVKDKVFRQLSIQNVEAICYLGSVVSQPHASLIRSSHNL
ncbi:hypothetical protein CMV_001400 [Castanea mollissima]|uniref:Uncharacterized protein n=1 Tax=Castanea mollissima TaxID=60419 RepID=A0A8J4RRL5_9ROSI|nr:hypothetical protein CMV_001400 [Castanea mollissima]